MEFLSTNFENLYLIKLDANSDFRGNFSRIFCEKVYSNFNINFAIKQVSLATNIKKHTLRGIHFQKHPMQEQKLLHCLRGEIWDVVVDIRKNSKTFGKWQNFHLDKNNCLFIPSGFAHGYITLTNKVEIIYFMDEFYDSQSSKGLIWNDKEVNILWPYQPKVISKKDQNLFKLNEL